ncbi:Vms1/Ankzf1 family peptidyl-tRNA hydrolase [Halobacteriaceae archaeon GCM10025711]
MLDELLGRAGLKERIAELEERNERLQKQLDAENDRRAEAVSARQAAEERVNRLEDRIAELEDRVERAGGDRTDLSFRGTEDLRNDRLDAVLARLDSVDAGPEGALTAMVGDEMPDAVRDAVGNHAPLVDRAAPCLVVTDDAGLVSAALDPPVRPDPFVAWSDGFDLDRKWFEPTDAYAVALVRSDVFALGEYRDGDRVSFTGFESDVKGDHSKGGFSQGRFERRRDAQIDEHLDKCRDAIRDRDAERLYVVGEKTLLGEFEDVAAATAAVDATGRPEAALGEAVADFWTTRLYLL